MLGVAYADVRFFQLANHWPRTSDPCGSYLFQLRPLPGDIANGILNDRTTTWVPNLHTLRS